MYVAYGFRISGQPDTFINIKGEEELVSGFYRLNWILDIFGVCV